MIQIFIYLNISLVAENLLIRQGNGHRHATGDTIQLCPSLCVSLPTLRFPGNSRSGHYCWASTEARQGLKW